MVPGLKLLVLGFKALEFSGVSMALAFPVKILVLGLIDPLV